MKNKELPADLVEEVRRAMANGDLGDESVPYYYHEAQAALSVISPYYEKQIAELKDIIKNGEHVNFYDINKEELAELTLFFEKVMRVNASVSFSIFQTICHLKAIKAKPPAE